MSGRRASHLWLAIPPRLSADLSFRFPPTPLPTLSKVRGLHTTLRHEVLLQDLRRWGRPPPGFTPRQSATPTPVAASPHPAAASRGLIW
ncbi:unnamed protein product [Urochloa humidicola]